MGRKRKSTDCFATSSNSNGDCCSLNDTLMSDDEYGVASKQQTCNGAASNGGSSSSANARERARMRVLSRAFVRLKTTLPWVPADTKLSKLDTLRLATCYIAHLRHVLAEDDGDSNDITLSEENKITSSPAIYPMNLTWPYSFGPRQSTDCRLPQRMVKFTTSSTSSTSNRQLMLNERKSQLHMSS